MPEQTQSSPASAEQAAAKGPIARFLALPVDSLPKTMAIAVSLCLVASMAVSALAVSLRPVQEANKLQDKQMNVLQVAGIYEEGQDIAEAFSAFELHVLELESGEFSDQFDPREFDDLAAAEDPATSVALTEDPAGIGRQATHKTVYLLRDDAGEIDKVVLPIHGYGLWSTLYGFIAVEENGDDIYGLQFYEHGETPGLGAEVDNPRWKAQWRGKQLFNDNGELAINVAKSVDADGAEYHVDSLSGATLTSDGVDNLVRFWMSEEGYGAFLDNLRAGEI
ncbi:MAG: Na(+)-translocating NADH-quinone reductase subunit C [Pseudomonadota bacterium]